ncbi:type II secretion system protein [Salinispirillum marinum]|uniref:Type II secretion system protein n=2 Tax=Saccharospirillaceae TaxID=255527 RepID=A0ABV8BBT7_9GAMM
MIPFSLHQRPQRGFTLIELIMVIVLVGIIATVVGPIVGNQFQAYSQSSARAEQVENLQGVMQRILLDVGRAVPNSVEVSNGEQTLTFLVLSPADQGRQPFGVYSTPVAAAVSELNVLDCLPNNQGHFVVLGPLDGDDTLGYYVEARTDNSYDQGPVTAFVSSANIIAQNCATTNPITTLTLPRAHAFPVPSPSQRLYLTTGRVEYRCVGNTLQRVVDTPYAGINGTVPTQTPRLLSNNVSACRFSLDGGSLSVTPTLTLALALTQNEETVRLVQFKGLVNAP